MSKAYFIGGAPRTGKTNLTLSVLKNQPMLASSTDALRYTLRQVLSSKEYPHLFRLNDPASFNERILQFTQQPELSIQMQNEESLIVWKSVIDFAKSNLMDGFDILIEGTAILPEYLEALDIPYSAVFIGNQSDKHFETTLRTARANKNDWLHTYDDATVRSFCTFNQAFSAFLENECSKHGQTYIEINDQNYDQCLDDAKKVLLS